MIEAGYSVVREGTGSLEPAEVKNRVPMPLEWLEANEHRVQEIAKDVFARRAKGAGL